MIKNATELATSMRNELDQFKYSRGRLKPDDPQRFVMDRTIEQLERQLSEFEKREI